MVWLATAAIQFIVIGLRLRQFGRKLGGHITAPADLHERVQFWASRLRLRSAPAVWLIPGAFSPMVWGFGLTPRLLLPQALWDRLDNAQRDALIVHEMAHLLRRDHWVRVLEIVVSALFWWFPLVPWAQRVLRVAEEKCCDAWVLWALPEATEAYADALLETVDYLSASAPAVPAWASGLGQFEAIKQRLTSIMQGDTPKGMSRAGVMGTLCTAVVLMPLALPRPQPSVTSFRLVELGTLVGEESWALAMNAAGEVVGERAPRPNPRDAMRAFRSCPDAMFERGLVDISPPWARRSSARSINNRGQVLIGAISETAADNPADVRTNLVHAVRYDSGDWIWLGALDDISWHIAATFAGAINDVGQAVGTTEVSRRPDDAMVIRRPTQRREELGTFAFRTSPGQLINPATDDIGELGYLGHRNLTWVRSDGDSKIASVNTPRDVQHFASAHGINNQGQVVGSTIGPNGYLQAFRTAPNRPIDRATDGLGVLPGQLMSMAHAINNAGQVVGESGHAFRTRPNRSIDPRTDDLGTLGGQHSEARAINDAGVVVGSSETGGPAGASHAFVHDGRRMIDLNDTIASGLGLTVLNAVAVNERGQIACTARALDGSHRAVRLDPISPADSIGLALLGLCIAGQGVRTAQRTGFLSLLSSRSSAQSRS
jgi:probable HAF family extracellular repeat protein